jgi:hypothetical protein
VRLPEQLLVGFLGGVVGLSRWRERDRGDVGTRGELALLKRLRRIDLLLVSKLARSVPLSDGSVLLQETSGLDPRVVLLTTLDAVEEGGSLSPVGRVSVDDGPEGALDVSTGDTTKTVFLFLGEVFLSWREGG